ncbi:hypothetical protein WJU16_03100 [Chitinophaga pollutisoli]|uniref:Uncharacterized protein n=1 Tax=Chitinophaga pollutisoli TaxID=3133966 RepID=A0ABZ2YRD3_9BACT
MKKMIMSFLVGAAVVGTAFAADSYFAQANQFYAKSPSTGICKRIVLANSVLATEVQKGIAGAQATLTDVTGDVYTIWEDAACNTTQVQLVAF